MTRRLLLTLTSAAAAALVPAAAADAAKPAPYPSVSKIEPRNLGIGDTLTITGRNFVAGAKKNTVVFKRDGKRALFVKAAQATPTKLTVVVPESVRKALGKRNGVAVPSLFRVRVLSRRFAKSYSAKDLSPRIGPRSVGDVIKALDAEATRVGATATAPGGSTPTPPPADCDRDGVLDPSDADDDNDGLTDAFELSIRTGTCAADSDGDGMSDAWEYTSAVDLNAFNLPYPGKRPHPNPLDGSDRDIDFDGDGLTAAQEHRLWVVFGGGVLPLNYSDGTQATGRTVPAPTDPALAHLDVAHRGQAPDGVLSDDERDADGDKLGNLVEAKHQMQTSWWTSVVPFAADTQYPLMGSYDGTDFADRDTDGDGVQDGDDDQDFDGWSNVIEFDAGRPPTYDAATGTWRPRLYTHPFNPCLPDVTSRTCALYVPVANQDKPYPPFDGHLYYDHDGNPATGEVIRPQPMQWPLATTGPAGP